MSSCFDNLVGIRGCTTVQPRSGLYINDLEGISIKTSALIAEAEKGSGRLMLEEKILFAAQLMQVELAHQFARVGVYRLNSVIGSLKVGYRDYRKDPNPAGYTPEGIIIDRVSTERFANLWINAIEVYPLETASGVELNIDNGHETTTYTFDVVANQPKRVNIDYNTTEERVTLLLDQTVQWSYTHMFDPSIGGRRGCRNCPGGGAKSEDYLRNLYVYSTGNSSQTYGMRVDASLVCEPDTIWCVFPPRDLGMLLLYRSGVEIMNEAQNADRLNYVTLDKARHKHLQEAWMNKYNELADTLFEGMQPKLQQMGRQCISCRSPRIAWAH